VADRMAVDIVNEISKHESSGVFETEER
jgi:hypothetical protein